MKKSLLYGNGLSLFLTNYIKAGFDYPYLKYLDSTSFLIDFLKASNHSRIYRKFIKFFEITEESLLVHEQTKQILTDNINDISLLGFERWFSKNLFNKEIDMRSIKGYLYFFYNYWYSYIVDEILSLSSVQEIINKFANQLKLNLQDDYSIYTTNFDTLLDTNLNPNHLHGRFCETLNSYLDVVAFHISSNDFEYKYLFGTNGFEKFHRLEEIAKHDHPTYDLDFFYNDNVFYGDMLIYGISFGRAEVFTDPFLSKYPSHQGQHLFNSVDGHLIVRLESLFTLNQINSLTIAYYSEQDLQNYKHYFSQSKITNFVQYKQCSEVLTIE